MDATSRRLDSWQSRDTPDADAAGLGIAIRPLASAEEYAACVALQRMTWGQGYRDCVPAALLKITQRLGGVSAGAFDVDGRLLGFVYGMTGTRDGRLIHWSHMLAVRPELRNHGIARMLKEHQRGLVRAAGVEAIFWTFDPLVARNGHLNLTRLGASVCEYVQDMYGDTGSDLHAYGTDRFIVRWATDDAEHGARADGMPEDVPVVTGSDNGTGEPSPASRPPFVRIEVPHDVDAVAARSLAEARAWRATTRHAFLRWLGSGYSVVAFLREPAAEQGERSFYLLARPDAAADSAC